MNAAMVQQAAHAAIRSQDGGSTPTSPLQQLTVAPVSFKAARSILVRHHYLHSLPGGTRLAFGVFRENRIMGAMTFGSGPVNAFALVEGAKPDDCLTLSRFWLSDELPANSESRSLGVALRSIRKHTSVKFIVSYADPSQGHMGIIYQATGWVYTGLSEAMPLFDLGDGKPRHSRSLSHAYGTHSTKYFESQGVEVRVVPQAAKHRYVYFLDRSFRERLKTQVLPYPRKGVTDADD